MPIRPDNTPEDAPEDVLEMQMVLQELQQIKDGQNYLRVVLLGGNYQNVVHVGRLPQLEESIAFERAARKRLDERIEMLEEEKKLEKVARRSAMRTAAAIGSAIGTACGVLMHLAITYLRQR